MIYRQFSEIQISVSKREDRDFVQKLIMENQLDKFVSVAIMIYRANGGFVKENEDMEEITKLLGVHGDILSKVEDFCKNISATLNSSRVESISKIDIESMDEVGSNKEIGMFEDDIEIEIDGDSEEEEVDMEEIIRRNRMFSGK